MADTTSGCTSFPECFTDSRTLFQLATITACLGVLYFSTFKSMVYDWSHLPDYSHGFLIPFISLYLAWDRLDKVNGLPATPSNSGILVILFGLALLLLGNLSVEYFTMRFSFLLVVAGIVLFMLGWDILKLFLFPIFYLVFMIPIPSILLTKITFPMQLFASKLASGAIALVGIPVLREGNVLVLACTSLEVAEACSGIRSLISLLAVGSILAYYNEKAFWPRAVIVLSCLPIAIFVNVMRVTGTGILAHYYGPAVAEGALHDFAGYAVFILAMALMWAFSMVVSKTWRRLTKEA